MSDGALLGLWKNEITGIAETWVRNLFIYDEELAVLAAEQSVMEGADPGRILSLMEELTGK
jgi:hypothetical protein